MKKLTGVAALSLLVGCATAYQHRGWTGGFSETPLAENTYQVRVEANAYSSRDRVAQYLLRRCAEIALEKGRRYFRLAGNESQTATAGSGWGVYSFPSNQAIVTILDSNQPGAFDAVLIIPATNEAAGGVLSPAARKTLTEIQLGAAPSK